MREREREREREGERERERLNASPIDTPQSVAPLCRFRCMSANHIRSNTYDVIICMTLDQTHIM